MGWVEGPSEWDDARAVAATAGFLGLRETGRALQGLCVEGAQGRGPPSPEEQQGVLATLDHESASIVDEEVARAYRRARALLAHTEADVQAGRLGARYFEGIDRFAESTRHFEEAVEAGGKATSAARRAASSVRLLRHLWLIETTMKTLEVRSFAAFVPLEGQDVPTPEASLLGALHRFMEVEARYPVRMRGAAGTFRCADAMLLRNAVAHAAVDFEPSGAIEAHLFDREGDRPVGTLRLTPSELDDWYERLALRIRFFAFLVDIVASLGSAVDAPPDGGSLAAAWARKGKAPQPDGVSSGPLTGRAGRSARSRSRR